MNKRIPYHSLVSRIQTGTILGLLILMTQGLFAQSANLILFTENNVNFTLHLDGKKINTVPTDHLKVTDLTEDKYQMKVVYSNPRLGSFEHELYLNKGTEITFGLQKGAQGENVFQFFSESSLTYSPKIPTLQTTHSLTGSGDNGGRSTSVQNLTGIPKPNGNNPVNINTNTNIDNGNNSDLIPTEGIKGGAVSIEIVEPKPVQTEIAEPNNEGKIDISGSSQPSQGPSHVPGYTGPIGCDIPMNQRDFQSAKSSIQSKSFDDTKLRIAEQVAQGHCLLTSQIVEVMELFSFESNRLEFAKFAYRYTYDMDNYYKINDAFTFGSSIAELRRFLEQGR